jgi:hypothetical protein
MISGNEFAAVHAQRTLAAFGTSGCADLSAKQHDSVTKIATFFFRENGSELLFYFFRIFTLRQSQTATDPDAVGVANHTAGYSIKITE